MIKLFEVGGCVRDEILGLKSKDIDFVNCFNAPLKETYAGLSGNASSEFKLVIFIISN